MSMSQTLTQDPDRTVSSSSSEFPGTSDFDYKPVPPTAPMSVVLALCSVLSLVTLAGVPIALLGLILGMLALLKIVRSDGQYRGRILASAGTVLSAFFLTTGSAIFAYTYATEVPQGFQRVNFPKEIAKHKFVIRNGRRALPPEVEPLVGKKLFLKGFMYQSMQTDGINSFTLLKDSGECCFGGQPKPYDMIKIRLTDGQTTRSYSQTTMIYVAGVLSADPAAPPGKAVYFMDVDFCGRARTAF